MSTARCTIKLARHGLLMSRSAVWRSYWSTILFGCANMQTGHSSCTWCHGCIMRWLSSLRLYTWSLIHEGRLVRRHVLRYRVHSAELAVVEAAHERALYGSTVRCMRVDIVHLPVGHVVPIFLLPCSAHIIQQIIVDKAATPSYVAIAHTMTSEIVILTHR